jgi:peptide/nickel transport system substrate-binding protein
VLPDLPRNPGILPEVYAKSLLYRSPNLTNVFVRSYYGMYKYSELGLK